MRIWPGPFHNFTNTPVWVHEGGGGGLAPSIWGGVIGGITVLIGVLIAEHLTRQRVLNHKVDDGFWGLMATSSLILFDTPTDGVNEINRKVAAYLVELGKLHNAARPPAYNWKAIRQEVDEIVQRVNVSAEVWRTTGTAPRTEDLLGGRIGALVRREPKWWRS